MAEVSAASGLRVALSDSARSICVADEGCAGEPKGTVQVQPLQPPLRSAVSDALVAAGFAVVEVGAERDMDAGIEWHGTDTIALELRSTRGALIDQTSFRRSLDRCRDLADLTWDTCWAANFDSMKDALTRPLRKSTALLDFAHKTRGDVTAADTAVAATPTDEADPELASSRKPLRDRLDDLELQATVAHYREQLDHTCWQRALNAREPTAPSSAKVSTAITIQPSGNVSSVTTADDPPGYLGLASCIVDEVQKWRFSPAKSVTTASIPFIFAGN